MSTKAQFSDHDDFIKHVNQVRSGQNDWLCVCHVDDNPNSLKVEQSGSGGPDELVSLLRDTVVQYCLVRIIDVIDNTAMPKFIYIHWIGSKVPIVKLGKYGVVHGSIQELFQPYHNFIETSSLDELSEEALTKRIKEISGTKSKVVENDQIDQTAKTKLLLRGNNMNKTNFSKAVSAISATHKFTQNTKLSGKDLLELDSSALETIRLIRNVQDPDIKWILLTYEDKNCRGPIILHATGGKDSSLDELKNNLSDDKVFYGIYTLNQIVDSIDTLKYVAITFVGSRIPIMAKAIIGTHRQTVEDALGSCHASIVGYTVNDISESIIQSKLIKATN